MATILPGESIYLVGKEVGNVLKQIKATSQPSDRSNALFSNLNKHPNQEMGLICS